MSKNAIYGLISMVLVVGVVVGIWYWQQSDSSNQYSTADDSAITMGTEDNTNNEGGQGMQSEDITVGTGEEAVAGKSVTVHYVGTLPNGTKFDASRDHGDSGFTFVLGAGQVIQGWDQGVAGMKVGGVRKLTIPPELGYGSQAMGSIPANSTLLFEVELLSVN